MLILKRVRFLGAVTVLAGIPLFPLTAQTPPRAAPPSARQPGTELPKAPIEPQQNPLIGLAVFSSDGSKLGIVESVDGEPDGRITAINIKIGAFLGFGTKVVAIPEGKFQRADAVVQVGMTAEEVAKLPAVKDQT
jgi:PRC-barrel domain protein